MARWDDEEPDYDEEPEPEKDDDSMMSITTYIAGSCAASAISNVGSHKNAPEAMKAFCKMELGVPSEFGSRSFNTLAAFYIFTAGPEEKGHYHSKPWVKYGTEFAAFIRANSLGRVVSAGKKLNKKHHATTTCQVWTWSPSQEALEKWWKDQIEQDKKVK